jgi:hypothetical protein
MFGDTCDWNVPEARRSAPNKPKVTKKQRDEVRLALMESFVVPTPGHDYSEATDRILRILGLEVDEGKPCEK